MTFRQWKNRVNAQVAKTCGLGCDDLPDWDYWSAYDSGMIPSEAAREVLEEADFPFDCEQTANHDISRITGVMPEPYPS